MKIPVRAQYKIYYQYCNSQKIEEDKSIVDKIAFIIANRSKINIVEVLKKNIQTNIFSNRTDYWEYI